MKDRLEVNMLVLIANLAVLGFTLKLYTELFKDKAFDKRARSGSDQEYTGPRSTSGAI